MSRHRCLNRLALTAALSLAAGSAFAQAFPTKSITMLVP